MKLRLERGKDGDANEDSRGKVCEAQDGKRSLAADAAFKVVDDGQACR